MYTFLYIFLALISRYVCVGSACTISQYGGIDCEGEVAERVILSGVGEKECIPFGLAGGAQSVKVSCETVVSGGL